MAILAKVEPQFRWQRLFGDKGSLTDSQYRPDLEIDCHAWPELTRPEPAERVEWVVGLLALTDKETG